MRMKIGILFLLIVAGANVFADDAIIRRNYSLRDKSAINFSNNRQKTSSVNKINSTVMDPAIKELKQKIKKDSGNYILYLSLADAYLKSKQYEQAFDCFEYLYNLKKENKLDNETLSDTAKMFMTYKKATNKESELFDNLAVMAMILDNEDALDYATRGIIGASNTVLARKTLYIVFNADQEPTKALSACERILLKNPDDIEVMKVKASYNMKLNQNKEATSEYIRILDTNPDDDVSRYYLFKMLTAKKHDDKELLRKLYAHMSPFDFEQAYVSLAELLVKNEDYSSAKPYIEHIVKKYEQNPNGYILMADMYKREGKVKDAYDILSKARDKADNNETIAKYNVMLAKLSDEPVKEANSLMANGLYQQAVDVLNSANPDDLYVILTQARAYYLLGSKEKTFELLNKAMSLYSDNSDVYCAFGYIYLQEKDTESARNYVNQSLELDKNNRTAKDLLDLVNKADSEKYMAGILEAIESQNYNEAMRLVDEAMAIDGKSADLYYYKSIIYIAMNNYAMASSSLTKCLQLEPMYIDAYFYLGATLDNLGEKEKAVKYYNRFIELTQGNEIGKSEKIDYAKTRLTKIKSKV